MNEDDSLRLAINVGHRIANDLTGLGVAGKPASPSRPMPPRNKIAHGSVTSCSPTMTAGSVARNFVLPPGRGFSRATTRTLSKPA